MADDALEQQLAALPPERLRLYRQMMAGRGGTVTHELSEAQRGLWFLDRLVPRSPLYTMTWTFDLTGPLDVSAFTMALNDVVARHEALRTRFGVLGERPVQLVEPRVTVEVPVDDLRGRMAAAAQIVSTAAAEGLDLARVPPLRLRLLRVGDERHVAVVSTAHILVDGVSCEVFLRDLRAAYAGRVAGVPASAEAAFQFGAFVAWQRERLAGLTGERLAAYWRRVLDGAPGLIELPTGRVRPPVQSFRGASRVVTLPPAAVRPMRDAVREQGCSLFMGHLAVVATLLGRYTGRTDVCIGTPVANRVRPEHMSMIGLCANMIVVRVDLSGDPTFRQLLERVRDVCLDGFGHAEMPFDRLVDVVGARRGAANPLFQIACLLAEEEEQDTEAGGAVFGKVVTVPSGAARFDVSLPAVVTGEEIEVTVDYSSDVLDDALSDRLCGHLSTLWRDAAVRPDVPLSRLTMLTPGEQGQQAPVVSTPAGFALPAEAPAGATAVSDGRSQISYAELDTIVSGLSTRLAAVSGPVAVRIDRSVELAVALLALIRAGASVATGPAPAIATISLAPGSGHLGPAHQARYQIAVQPGEAGRGSECVRQAALAGTFARAADSIGLRGGDRLAITAAEQSPLFLAQLVAALTAGAGCRLLDPALAGDPPALRQALVSQRLTAAWLPRWTVAALTSAGPLPVRLVVTDPDAAEVAGACMARVHSLPGSGPWAVTQADVAGAGGAPVVAPLPGVEVHVLDCAGQPMPLGLIGELFLPGTQTGRAAQPVMRVLRRTDGLLELHGTAVEVRGALVPVEAVERRLLRHHAVREAYVTVDPDDRLLTAFVVPQPGEHPEERDLLGFLSDTLPAHMLPDAVAVLTEVPLTGDGRLDRQALPWPRKALPGSHADYVAPRSALERLVVAVWSELFARDQIGIRDNFFELGGHSLLGVRLLGILSELFGTLLPVSVLFGAATPEQLARRLASSLGGEDVADQVSAAVEEALQIPAEEVRRRLGSLSHRHDHAGRAATWHQ